MKKKFLISLLTITVCLILVGCGKENNLNNTSDNNSNTNQTSENTNINNNTSDDNNTSNSIIMDDEIIDIDDEDNAPIGDGHIDVKEVINCDGCVYAYFSDEGDKAKTLGSTLSSNEYTTDINNLKTSGGKQRHNFFGLVLSGNTISRAYACILKDDKIYCIEGSTNGAYHNSNISILNKIFASSQCKTISDGHTYTCTDGSYNGDTKTNGYTSLHYETSCTIYGSNSNTGKLICH
ncbi:MAG: hypothetical protein IJK67_06850 [Bacilli bacterium]|nr:hypothetical protein [Bacilli bacterium]